MVPVTWIKKGAKIMAKSIYQKLEETVYPALLRHFKESEGKEYDHQNGTNQCDTRDGMFYYGQIVLCEEILNREI